MLGNIQLNDVWNDPLLRYSNIMRSLFYNSVALCESDSDCKLYGIIHGHICEKQGNYSEVLFIHCGGKQRMAKVVGALRRLDINIKLIPDLDVLNDKNTFKGITDAYGIPWDTIEKDYKCIVDNVGNAKKKVRVSDASCQINAVFSATNDTYLKNTEIEEIKNAVSSESQWTVIKKNGVSALPSGDATDAFNKMNGVLKENNIFLVPVGELECFVKDVGGHGPDWVNKVLEKHQNLDADIYGNITNFIKDVFKV